MVVRVLSSVTKIAAEDWGRLSEPRLLFETQGWLTTNEPSLSGDAVVTAEFDGAALKSVVVWRAVDSSDSSPYYNIAALLARLAEAPAPVHGGWTLNCTGSGMHSPMLTAPGVVFDAARLRAHIDAAGRVRDEPPAMCGFNFLPDVPAAGLPGSLADLGFREIRGYQRAVLEISADSYEGYLAALSSRQRWNARRDRKRYAESGQRVSVATGPAAAGEDLIRLQGYNRLKYGMPHDEQELREKHTALLRCVGDDGLVIRSHKGDSSTGFAMFFRLGTALHALFAGFEPSDDRTGPYFEVLFHAAIEWACRNGITKIDYGIGSTTAKAERGCRIDDVSTWYLPPRAPLAPPSTRLATSGDHRPLN